MSKGFRFQNNIGEYGDIDPHQMGREAGVGFVEGVEDEIKERVEDVISERIGDWPLEIPIPELKR